MDLIDMLLDTDDEYVVVLGKLIHQAVTNIGERLEEFGDDEDKYYLSLSMEFHAALCKTELEYAKIDKEYNDTQSPFALFGEAENDLVRAYINNVGRQNDLSTFNFRLFQSILACRRRRKTTGAVYTAATTALPTKQRSTKRR